MAADFDPFSIAPFSVFWCKHEFPGDPDPLYRRRFICLKHETINNQKLVLCVKATTNIARYLNNPKRAGGYILYKAGDLPFFEKDTVIDPEGTLAIPHYTLAVQYLSGDFKQLGSMPAGFSAELATAARNSVEMTPKRKRILLGFLGVSE